MSDSPLSSRLSGYHDFGGLASLRGEAAVGDKAGALRETAKQFEAYFIQHMMKTMREAMERSDLVDNGNSDQFQELMDKEVAMKMAERGSLGLADMLERNLQQRLEPTTHQALTAREKAWPPQAHPLSLQQSGSGGLPLPARGQGALPLKVRNVITGAGDE